MLKLPTNSAQVIKDRNQFIVKMSRWSLQRVTIIHVHVRTTAASCIVT